MKRLLAELAILTVCWAIATSIGFAIGYLVGSSAVSIIVAFPLAITGGLYTPKIAKKIFKV